MKAMALVAHPDDCVIFAYSFIHHHPEYEWTICYLTHTETSSRGKEFFEFWRRRNISTKFLGFTDNWEVVKNGDLGFDPINAEDAIKRAITDQDIVLTHDHQGDYGHIHHVFVNRTVCWNHNQVVCFAGPGQGNVKYTIDPGVYSLDEVPLHRDIIAGFHPHTHTNEYTITEKVRKIL